MVHTGQEHSLSQEFVEYINELSKTLEYYLPDEKISRKYQETEVISTAYPDFEAVFFERDHQKGYIYIAEGEDFFPLFIAYKITELGMPTFAYNATFGESDMIHLEEGTPIQVIGFGAPENVDELLEDVPTHERGEDIDLQYLMTLAGVLRDEIH